MSYFPIADNNQINTENIPTMSEDKVNPRFSGHSHSEKSRQKISETQLARYEAMRKLVRKGMSQPLTEDRVKQICNETIADYIKKNAIRADNKNPININL